MIPINKLTFLGFYLNGALGSGRYNDIEIDQVKGLLASGGIYAFLEERLGHDVDFSILKPDEREELLQEWRDMADSVNESRKMCVEKNGLCLLVAYLLEGIQRRNRQ